MPEPLFDQVHALQGQLSFRPLMKLWHQAAKNKNGFAAWVCQDLHQRFSGIRALAKPVVDAAVATGHQGLLEEAFATIFPAAFWAEGPIYAVGAPFSGPFIYASQLWNKKYQSCQNDFMFQPEGKTEKGISEAKVRLAYKLILKKWYQAELTGGNSFICTTPDGAQHAQSYFQVEWDARFVDIVALARLPILPAQHVAELHDVAGLLHFPALSQMLPLKNFEFRGFFITHVHEVSEQETVNNIRGLLQQEDIFENEPLLNKLKDQIRYLLNVHDAEIGFTVLYHGNKDEEIQTINPASVLLKGAKSKTDLFVLCNEIKEALHQHSGNYLWLKTREAPKNAIEEHLAQLGFNSAAFISLYYNKMAIGCLELFARNGRKIDKKVLGNFTYVQELLQYALHLYRYRVLARVNEIVQQHFTAIQPDVAWKFNNAAVHFLKAQPDDAPNGMEAIVFENITPIYGAIDIRNSSGERLGAVQEDLLQQLNWIIEILQSVPGAPVPRFRSMQDAVNHFSNNILHSAKEADLHQVQFFLKEEMPPFLDALKCAVPTLASKINHYAQKLDETTKLLNEGQKSFEESVEKINRHITGSLKKAQAEMQKIYPHYFEQFVTDGVEYNMYIGQAIAPHKELSKPLISSIRFCHLFFLAQMVRELHQLATQLAKPLHTTQLILAYSRPVSIRFRTDERKFDMDGVRHVHFEIIKKRIEKVKVKASGQRLTQPGTIAVVYTIEAEKEEYFRFMEILLANGVLAGEIEILELEELQGISGLKSLRATVKSNPISLFDA